MIESFSNGYYIKDFWITPENQHEILINNKEYNYLKNIYKDNPILIKLNKKHFKVNKDKDIPKNTMQIPKNICSNVNLKRVPDKYPILLLKPFMCSYIYKL